MKRTPSCFRFIIGLKKNEIVASGSDIAEAVNTPIPKYPYYVLLYVLSINFHL